MKRIVLWFVNLITAAVQHLFYSLLSPFILFFRLLKVIFKFVKDHPIGVAISVNFLLALLLALYLLFQPPAFQAFSTIGMKRELISMKKDVKDNSKLFKELKNRPDISISLGALNKIMDLLDIPDNKPIQEFVRGEVDKIVDAIEKRN